MIVTFECPYCGELISDADDLEFIRSNKICSVCEAGLDDVELDELLPEEGDDPIVTDEDDEYGDDEEESVEMDMDGDFSDDLDDGD